MSIEISDYLDWSLSKSQKKKVAFAFGFFACIGMIISFPNTLLFFAGKIIIFERFVWMNDVMSVVAAIFVNGVEILALYFAVWQIKENLAAALLAVMVVLGCAYYSCVGTFGTLETGDKIVQTEEENLYSHKKELENIQKNIDEKTNLLAANNQQIARLESQGLNVQTRIYNRSLQLSNELDDLNYQYKEKSKETRNANKNAPKTALSKGGNSIFNSTFSPVFEFLMLLCTTLSILVYREKPNENDDNKNGNTNNYGTQISNGNNRNYQPQLTPAMAKKNVGFDVNDDTVNFQNNSKKSQSEVVNETSEIVLPLTRDNKNTLVDFDKRFNNTPVNETYKKNSFENTNVNSLDMLSKTQFAGKTDPYILYVFDNWTRLTEDNISLRNIEREVKKLLPARMRKKGGGYGTCSKVLKKYDRKY